jgi:hypothetical protein
MAQEGYCSGCRYWLVSRDEHGELNSVHIGDGDFVTYGQCRRFPPTDRYEQDVEVQLSRFPLTTAGAWCGEHAPANPQTFSEGATQLARHVILGDRTAARALADKLKEDGE